jgi:hypothetical protein
MIHYQLCCEADHSFDGWFKDSDTFDQQAEARLVSCPTCGSTAVRRALMAPGIHTKERRKRAPVIEAEAGLPPPAMPESGAKPLPAAMLPGGAMIPDQVRAVLSKLRAEIEKNCDNVGAEFASEARKIHRGEAPVRGIYGQSTEAEAEALADEGIIVAQIPWLPRADS